MSIVNAGILLLGVFVAAGNPQVKREAQVAATQSAQKADVVIQDYRRALSGECTANPRVRLAVDTDPAVPGESVLLVDYPEPTGDPASRDVRCDAEARDWTAGRAIVVRVKPTQTVRMSMSFIDRNGVVYTTWQALQDGVWQTIRIPFDELRPNPSFQPPGARIGAPLDVSDVTFIAFAPQGQTSGRLAIARFVVSK